MVTHWHSILRCDEHSHISRFSRSYHSHSFIVDACKKERHALQLMRKRIGIISSCVRLTIIHTVCVYSAFVWNYFYILTRSSKASNLRINKKKELQLTQNTLTSTKGKTHTNSKGIMGALYFTQDAIHLIDLNTNQIKSAKHKTR